MYKKYFLIAGFVLVITGLLIHVSHANNLPEIKFEQACPDSIGAKAPTIFQIEYSLGNLVGTHSAACFYQKSRSER